MQGLLQDFKSGEFQQINLLCGEETYLRKQYRDRLKEALCDDPEGMNVNCFEGKDTNIRELIDLAETLPFFADRRVIVAENTGWLSKGGEELADYLAGLPETTFLILVEEQVDKRTRLYKEIKKRGRVSEFGIQDEETLKKWILGMLKKDGKQITVTAMNYFLERMGTRMDLIKNEVEKLLCYTEGRQEVTIGDINAVCTGQIQNHIFDMIEAIGKKDRQRALLLYYELLALKEPPMRILALIGRQFNYLLQVKDLRQKGCSTALIAEKCGLHRFVAGKYEQQAARFNTKELKRALQACAEADEQVKSGRIPDRMSVELLLVEYSA